MFILEIFGQFQLFDLQYSLFIIESSKVERGHANYEKVKKCYKKCYKSEEYQLYATLGK